MRAQVDLQTAAKIALSSMISTAHANLSVGPPYDLASTATARSRSSEMRIEADHPYLAELDRVWTRQLLDGVDNLPPIPSDVLSPVGLSCWPGVSRRGRAARRGDRGRRWRTPSCWPGGRPSPSARGGSPPVDRRRRPRHAPRGRRNGCPSARRLRLHRCPTWRRDGRRPTGRGSWRTPRSRRRPGGAGTASVRNARLAAKV